LSSRVVLSADDLSRSVKRISHEIIESISGLGDILVLGIPTRGVFLARRIAARLRELNPALSGEAGILDVTLYRDDSVSANRRIQETTLPASGLDNKIVVLVDDVLYSGRTIRAALDALVDFGRPKQVKLAVLVDRGHRELPIRPDFVGKNLPTAADERVNVLLLESDGRDEVVIEH
jgi:pyrimidine operon attenuation protein/uracil phosphoribosyltransferase